MVTISNNFKVLHIVISLETGGLERFVLDLIDVNNSQLDQIVVCLERKGDLTTPFETLSIDMPPGLQLSAAVKLARIARDHEVSLIHTHNEKAQFYGALAGLLAWVPVVHTKHGKNSTDWRSILRNNLAARLCKKIVAVSCDAAEQCVKTEMVPVAKVMTILNGVDTMRYSRFIDQVESRRLLGYNPDVPIIGVVARLALVKDHAALLAACRLIKNDAHEFRLLVVGDGPLRGELEALAVSLGLEDEVTFTGSRSDVPELMQAMDVFVLSSRSEGISLTLIEAMACELPIVATSVGGNPEVVMAGETGFLVPSNDPAALAAKIIQLLKSPEMRQKLGIQGRRRAEREFSLSRATAQYANLYHSILNENLI